MSAEKRSVEEDWRRRVVRRGYLFKADGDIFRVPRELYDLFRERWPEVGLDDVDAPRPEAR